LYQKTLYFEAVNYYESALNQDKPQQFSIEQQYHMAQCYMMSRIYEKAEVIFSNLSKLYEKKYPLSIYYRGLMLMQLERYSSAIAILDEFISKYGNQFPNEFEDALEKSAGCKKAISIKENPYNLRIDALPIGMNKTYANYSLVSFNDTLWFTGSIEINNSPDKIKMEGSKGKYDIYIVNRLFYSTYSSKNMDGERQELSLKIDNEFRHFSSPTFYPDGRFLLFSLCSMVEGKEQCLIMKANRLNGTFDNPQPINQTVNIEGLSSKHPMIVKIDNQVVLFYATTKSGGQGKYDIYHCYLDSYGNCDSPISAGKLVNTAGNEISPFYDHDKKTLYFSSDEHSGLGGYDVFKSNGNVKDGFYTTVENIGYPMNSGADDYFYSHLKTGKKHRAYISSNRPRSDVVNLTTCCDNLLTWEFAMQAPPKKLIIIDVKESPSNSPLSHFNYRIKNKATNEIVISGNSGDSSNIKYKLSSDSLYLVDVVAPGYDSTETLISFKEADTIVIKYLTVTKKEKAVEPIVVETPTEVKTESIAPVDKVLQQFEYPIIYFAFNKSDIQGSEYKKLNSIVNHLRENAETSIIISSHTDNIDTKGFNAELSKMRSEAVLNYLLAKGIRKDRMLLRWYGEASPLIENQQNNGSDNPEGRKRNRRTEFSEISSREGLASGLMVSWSDEDIALESKPQMGDMNLSDDEINILFSKYGDILVEGLEFKIQLGAFSKTGSNVELRKSYYLNLSQKLQTIIQIERLDGLDKYYTKAEFTLNKANDLCKRSIKEGVKGAFIVPYYKGKRIRVIDAIEYIGKKK